MSRRKAKRAVKATAKRKRGRPVTTGIGAPVMVRVHKEFLHRLDQWRGKASRPEAIRKLAELGLKVVTSKPV